MVSKSPRPGVVGPLAIGLLVADFFGGDPTYLLTGMILYWLVFQLRKILVKMGIFPK